MGDATQALEARVCDLERHVYRLLLIVGAAGSSMMAEVRRDDEEG
jgi:hypothetical protein